MSILRHLRARRWTAWEKVGVTLAAPVLTILVAVGIPASLYCASGTAAYLALAAAAERYDDVPNCSRSLSLRIRAGFFENSAELALYLAFGSGLVWLIGIGLSIADPDPDAFGPREVDFLEWAERYKQLVSAPHVVEIFVLTLLVATALNSLWPMLVAARLRQWAARLSIVLAGMTMFSFVGVGEAADRGETAVTGIKAAIASDVEELTKGQQENAAYHWLAASLQEQARATDSLAGLRRDLALGRKACNDATKAYTDAYEAAYPFHSAPGPFCEETAFTSAFAKDEIARPGEPARRGTRADWAPEFRGAVTVTPDSVSVVPPSAPAEGSKADSAIIGLQALHLRTSAAREEAESARKATRESVTALVASLFPELGSTLIGIVLDAWKETAVGIIADESADKVAERLRQNRVKVPIAVAAVLGIDGPLKLPPAGRTGGGPGAEKRIQDGINEARLAVALANGGMAVDVLREPDDPRVAGERAGKEDKHKADVAARTAEADRMKERIREKAIK